MPPFKQLAEFESSVNNKLYKALYKSLELTTSERDEHADTIRQVLSTVGFDVNSLEWWGRWHIGRSALHVACNRKIRSSVGAKILLRDERCDVNLTDCLGETALMTAVKWVRSDDDQYAEIIRLLLAHPHININMKSANWNNNQTALHKASVADIKSHVGAQLLISDKRCDVNVLDSEGNTPLMKAVRLAKYRHDKHAKIIRLLLAHPRIDVNLKGYHGKNTFHGEVHIRKLLQKRDYDIYKRMNLESHHTTSLHVACDLTAQSAAVAESQEMRCQ